MFKSDGIKNYFTDQLNKMYCAKAHLIERLPEIADHPDFADLKPAMQQAIEEMHISSEKMMVYYHLIKITPSLANCENLITLLEDGFNKIQRNSADREFRDFLIFDYLQSINNIQLSVIKVLQLIKSKVRDEAAINLLSEVDDTTLYLNSLPLFLEISNKKKN